MDNMHFASFSGFGLVKEKTGMAVALVDYVSLAIVIHNHNL
jgi:hypothetical protein